MNHDVVVMFDENAILLKKRITELEAERDEARANYQFMVNRACNEKLDGYRELGAKCASLEEERDAARAEMKRLRSDKELAEAFASERRIERDAAKAELMGVYAKVERLKATCATERKTGISLCIEVVDQYRRRFDRRSEFCAFDILSSAEGMMEKLLRDQLPTHTWQQERAQIVAWLRHPDRWNDGFTRSASYYATHIERGEHCPEGGMP
jgi:hypothetical protein